MSRTPIPTPAAIVEVLRSGASLPVGSREDPADPVVTLSGRLHDNNRRQWEREDDARRVDADDGVIAAAKRDIDRLNGLRHGYIEAIDRAFLQLLPPAAERAPLVTESPGMVIDRLSVLVLRLASTEVRAEASDPEAAAYGERLPRLRAQLAVLEEAATTLFDDLATGRRRFATYESLKLYGPPEPPRVP